MVGFLFRYNFRPEVYNDGIVSMDVLVKLGDSRSNGSRDIRGADFVSNEHDEAYPNSGKRLTVSPKNGARTLFSVR